MTSSSTMRRYLRAQGAYYTRGGWFYTGRILGTVRLGSLRDAYDEINRVIEGDRLVRDESGDQQYAYRGYGIH